MSEPQVRLSGGGVPANVKAATAIPASRFWKYSTTENEVSLCGSGEEADGICLVAVEGGEILNSFGTCYARKTTGQYDDVTIVSAFVPGGELMSDGSGQITAYVVSGDNRPLGKFLTGGSANQTGRILIYSK